MAADERDTNRDPLSDETGSHPVGTGVGAAGGAVAGAAAGMAAGPVGMAVGGVVGAVIGGLAGRAAAEAVNPTAEEEHWRNRYTEEPYYEQGRSFDDYGPAYRYGVESRAQSQDDWDTSSSRLEQGWDSARGGSSLSWKEAQPASRAAWDRVDTQLRSRSDSDSDMGSGGARYTTTDSSYTGSGGSTVAADDSLRAGSTLGGSTTSASGLGSGAAAYSGSMGTSGRDASYSDANPGGGSGMTTGAATTGGSTGTTGVASKVGEAQSYGENSGDKGDVIDILNDLVECCKDGEYGFRSCADNAKREDLRSLFQQRAEDCARGARELQEQVRSLGGDPDDSGSALGAVHRGWVSVKSTLSTYDDKAILEECERGEDNALARYRKALQKPLPSQVKSLVERQLQGVQRNHDQVKMLRNQFRAAS